MPYIDTEHMTCQQMDWKVCKETASLIPLFLRDIVRFKGLRHNVVCLYYLFSLVILSAGDCLAHALSHDEKFGIH